MLISSISIAQEIDWPSVIDRYYEKYQPTEEVDWVFPMIFKNGVGQRDTVYAGIAPDASDGLVITADAIYGELFIPEDSLTFSVYWSDCNLCDTLSVCKVNMAKDLMGSSYILGFRNAPKPVTLYYDPSLLYSSDLPFPDNDTEPRAWVDIFIDDFDKAQSNTSIQTLCGWVNAIYLTDSWPQTNFDPCAFSDSMTIVWEQQSQFLGYLGVEFQPWGLFTNTEELISNRLKISPNPIKDIMHLSFEKSLEAGSELSVKGITGRTVYHTKLSTAPNQTLSLHKLMPGLYFIDIRMSDGRRKQTAVVKS